MLQDVYDMLWSGQLGPRWIEGELHVEVHGRSFAVSRHPHGVAIRKQHSASPAESVADVCADTDQVLWALGLGLPGKPPIRDADYERRRRRDPNRKARPAAIVASPPRIEDDGATVEPDRVDGAEPLTRLREVHDRLVLQRFEPRWVDDELYVDVHGRALAVAERPRGLAVRVQGATAATLCDEPADALAALGVPRSARDARDGRRADLPVAPGVRRPHRGVVGPDAMREFLMGYSIRKK